MCNLCIKSTTLLLDTEWGSVSDLNLVLVTLDCVLQAMENWNFLFHSSVTHSCVQAVVVLHSVTVVPFTSHLHF